MCGGATGARRSTGRISCTSAAPFQHRFIGDDNAPFSQNKLNISQAEAENVIQPDRMRDDLGRNVMIARVGWCLHAPILSVFVPTARPSYGDNACPTATWRRA